MWNLKRFAQDEGGNVAMMFAGGLSMLLVLVGAGMDYSNVVRLENELQSQVDAAVLAAATVDVTLNGSNARNVNQEDIDIRRDAALSVLKTNGFDLDNIQPELQISRRTVVLKAEKSYTPFFGGLIGQKEMKISAVAESGLGEMQTVEIALVVDNTNSMVRNGKMAALKTGAINLVEAVEESGSGSEIALVPFARYVKIDESLWDAPWLDRPADIDTTITWQQATHTGGTCRTETRTRVTDGFEEEYQTQICENQTTTYEEQTRIEESRFTGCVGTRLPPFSESDDNYAEKIPGLLNSIPTQHTGLGRKLNAHCPKAIVPLTDDYADLKSDILALHGTDNTYLPSGLIWGQRVLSPGIPFDNPVSSRSPKRKIMVLMSDGKNTARINTSQDAQDHSFAPPYLEWVEVNDGYSPEANVVTARLCESIKSEGIEMITIAFQVNDVETKNLLQNCASNPAFAYKAESNEALIATFEDISDSLSDGVRLVR